MAFTKINIVANGDEAARLLDNTKGAAFTKLINDLITQGACDFKPAQVKKLALAVDKLDTSLIERLGWLKVEALMTATHWKKAEQDMHNLCLAAVNLSLKEIKDELKVMFPSSAKAKTAPVESEEDIIQELKQVITKQAERIAELEKAQAPEPEPLTVESAAELFGFDLKAGWLRTGDIAKRAKALFAECTDSNQEKLIKAARKILRAYLSDQYIYQKIYDEYIAEEERKSREWDEKIEQKYADERASVLEGIAAGKIGYMAETLLDPDSAIAERQISDWCREDWITENAYLVFGLERGNYTHADAKKRCNDLAKKHHPDRGGRSVDMTFINLCRDILIANAVEDLAA